MKTKIKIGSFLALIIASINAIAYEYNVSSGIFSVGNATINFQLNNGRYIVEENRNIHWPGIVKDISSTVVSGTYGDLFVKPDNYSQTRTGFELTRSTDISWNGGKPITSMSPKILLKEATVIDDNLLPNSIDPLSSILLMSLSFKYNHPCAGTFRSYDGFSVLEASLVKIKDKNISTSAFKGHAVGCRAVMVPIAGLVFSKNDNPEITNLDIWFAKLNDGQWLPVYIKTKSGSKTVSMKLTSE